MKEILSPAVMSAEEKNTLEDIERRRLATSGPRQCEGRFLCCQCHVLLVRHYLLRCCGHAFCGPCHQRLHLAGELCPKCQTPVTQEIEQSLQLEIDSYLLSVSCPNSGSGCTHECRVMNLLEHNSRCRFSSKWLLPKLRISNPVQELIWQVDNLTRELSFVRSRVSDSHQASSDGCENLEDGRLSENVKRQLLEKDVQINQLKKDLKEKTDQISQDINKIDKKFGGQLGEWVIRSREGFAEIKEHVKREESERKSRISQEFSEREDRLRNEFSRWEKEVKDDILEMMQDVKTNLNEDEMNRNDEMVKWRVEAKRKLSEMVDQIKSDGRAWMDTVNEKLDKWEKKTTSRIASKEIRLTEDLQEAAIQSQQEMSEWWERLTKELSKAKGHLEQTFNEKVASLQQSWNETEEDRKYQFQKWETRVRQQTQSAIDGIQQRYDEMESVSKIAMLENRFEKKWQEITTLTEKEIADWSSLMSQSLKKQRKNLDLDHNVKAQLWQQDWDEKEADRIHKLHKWESRLRQETQHELRAIKERCDELESSNLIGFLDLKNYILQSVDKIENAVHSELESIDGQLSQVAFEQTNNMSSFKDEISKQCTDWMEEIQSMFKEISLARNNRFQPDLYQIEFANSRLQSNQSPGVEVQDSLGLESAKQIDSTDSSLPLQVDWRITNFESKVDKGRNGSGKTYFSKEMAFNGRSKISWALKFEKDGVGVFFEITNEEEDPSNPNFCAKCTLMIIDRGSQEEKRNLKRTKEVQAGTSEAKCWLTNTHDMGKFSYRELNQIFKVAYVQNDSILIRMIVEPQDQPAGALHVADGVVRWTIDNFGNILNDFESERLQEIKSASFYNGRELPKFKILGKWKRESHFFEFYLAICDDYDVFVPKESRYEITFSILDQSNREEKFNVTKLQEHNFTLEMSECLLDSIHSSLFESTVESEQVTTTYMKNDVAIIQIKLEQCQAEIASVEPAISNDGVLYWNLREYEKTKENFISDVINFYENDSFEGSPPGYRLKAYAQWLKQTFVVGLFFLPGEIDKTEFISDAHKITFSILDQQNDNGNHLVQNIVLNSQTIVKKAANESLDWPYLGCHEVKYSLIDLEKPPFLVDNEIRIKITVEPDSF